MSLVSFARLGLALGFSILCAGEGEDYFVEGLGFDFIGVGADYFGEGLGVVFIGGGGVYFAKGLGFDLVGDGNGEGYFLAGCFGSAFSN